ncbi:hypothetical protein DBR47_18800 [Paucibacter sp. KBW04]|uniref:glycine zipper 2TM domain-containing protein n=1 Tax=Paucibacter sp. KBW04 TaxID=2153361 RepID=UPI000F56E602|nr:glycine zipper 2TM domain-containing protein [Paucibacter sp. KBW04]RQO55922.1 hypothetical protein DBR47_18800 [Paucibacter sp. KBW04]
MNSSVSTSQRFIAIALLAALLAGVYALGRSQSSKDLSAIPSASSEAATLSPAEVAGAGAAASSALTPLPRAQATPTGESSAKPVAVPLKSQTKHPSVAKPVEKNDKAATSDGASAAKQVPVAQAKPALCHECATVLSVRKEQRAGEASGLGAVGGAVIGGLLGNQIGGGNGKKLATVGGAAAGGYFGNEMEKKHKAQQVWLVKVGFSDASTRSFEFANDPGVKVDEVVRVRDGELIRQ